MANGMDQLGALFDWFRRGRPQAEEAPSRVGQFAMMPPGGLMGPGPAPQNIEQLIQADAAQRVMGGGQPQRPAMLDGLLSGLGQAFGGGEGPPPLPQQMNPDDLQRMQAMEAYRLLGGWGPRETPPPLPQQAPMQAPPAAPDQMVISPAERAAMYNRMRRTAQTVRPLTSRIDNTRRSRAGF